MNKVLEYPYQWILYQLSSRHLLSSFHCTVKHADTHVNIHIISQIPTCTHAHSHYALAYTYTPTHVNFSVMLPWKQSKHFKSILESKWRKNDKKVVEYSYHWILYHLFKKHLFCSSHWAVPHTDTHTQTCTCTHNVYNVTHTLHVNLHTHVDFPVMLPWKQNKHYK